MKKIYILSVLLALSFYSFSQGGRVIKKDGGKIPFIEFQSLITGYYDGSWVSIQPNECSLFSKISLLTPSSNYSMRRDSYGDPIYQDKTRSGKVEIIKKDGNVFILEHVGFLPQNGVIIITRANPITEQKETIKIDVYTVKEIYFD